MKVDMAKARAFPDRRSWRAWLKKNHDKERELWLIYYKLHTNTPTISYDESVEEALCFGWIDGIIQRIDDERFARRFTPRKASSQWSLSNLARMKRLDELGLLSTAAVVPTAKSKVVPTRQLDLPLPPDFTSALTKNRKAHAFFHSLTPSYRRLYVRWILAAKRNDTRVRRVQEAINLLTAEKKLPMK